jgi:hypothetical protein
VWLQPRAPSQRRRPWPLPRLPSTAALVTPAWPSTRWAFATTGAVVVEAGCEGGIVGLTTTAVEGAVGVGATVVGATIVGATVVVGTVVGATVVGVTVDVVGAGQAGIPSRTSAVHDWLAAAAVPARPRPRSSPTPIAVDHLGWSDMSPSVLARLDPDIGTSAPRCAWCQYSTQVRKSALPGTKVLLTEALTPAKCRVAPLRQSWLWRRWHRTILESDHQCATRSVSVSSTSRRRCESSNCIGGAPPRPETVPSWLVDINVWEPKENNLTRYRPAFGLGARYRGPLAGRLPSRHDRASVTLVLLHDTPT